MSTLKLRPISQRPGMIEWWNDPGEIARLLRWLHYDGAGLDVRGAIAVVEAPWHWDSEYYEMCAEQETASERKEDDRLARGEDVADIEEQR